MKTITAALIMIMALTITTVAGEYRRDSDGKRAVTRMGDDTREFKKTKQIASLEQRVAVLEEQVAELRRFAMAMIQKAKDNAPAKVLPVQ